MKISLNRIYFYAGTSILIIALFEVTLLPYLMSKFLPVIYVSPSAHKTSVMGLYVAAFLFYVSCKGYYKFQFIVLAAMFAYYFAFQFYIRMV